MKYKLSGKLQIAKFVDLISRWLQIIFVTSCDLHTRLNMYVIQHLKKVLDTYSVMDDRHSRDRRDLRHFRIIDRCSIHPLRSTCPRCDLVYRIYESFRVWSSQICQSFRRRHPFIIVFLRELFAAYRASADKDLLFWMRSIDFPSNLSTAIFKRAGRFEEKFAINGAQT